MSQYFIITLLILSIYSCADSTRSRETIKAQPLDSVFVPAFINRNDTSSFNIYKGKLIGKTQTLDILFGAISCTCAQWFETKYSKDVDNRNEFFLEPANTSLINADTIFNGNNLPIRLLVTGQFYLKKGYPENYRPVKGNPDPARVFRYNKIKIKSLGSSL